MRTKEIAEDYPNDLDVYSIPSYLAEKKAREFVNEFEKDVVVTSDTIVILEGKVLGKPNDEKHAFEMLQSLSGKKHDVVTGICILTKNNFFTFSELTEVYFKQLSEEEIGYYISRFKPFDKAGAYGIQEWIGMIGVSKIIGSYYNVMGFPIDRFYSEILKVNM